jgi:ferritin-like metal-binding protein YciE
MAMDNLRQLFVDELKDLYDAEHQITKALPKMQQAAKSDRLKEAFDMHLKQTQQQIKRLEQVFQTVNMQASGKTCKGMQGIIEEGSEMMREDADGDVKDAALIAAAQKVEHYEIAGYGTARTYAEMLGLEQAADLLQETLDEEAETDERLTDIAMTINLRAK